MSAMATDESGGWRRNADVELLLIDDEGVPSLALGEGDLGRPARRGHQGGSANRPAAGHSMGWVVVLAATLFLTALFGVAQIVAGQQAPASDDEVLASLANVAD